MSQQIISLGERDTYSSGRATVARSLCRLVSWFDQEYFPVAFFRLRSHCKPVLSLPDWQEPRAVLIRLGAWDFTKLVTVNLSRDFMGTARTNMYLPNLSHVLQHGGLAGSARHSGSLASSAQGSAASQARQARTWEPHGTTCFFTWHRRPALPFFLDKARPSGRLKPSQWPGLAWPIHGPLGPPHGLEPGQAQH